MIHSLFLINKDGEVLLEKHWRSVISKSVCDYLNEGESKLSAPDKVPPIIEIPNYFLINIFKKGIFFVAVCKTEVPPLFVTEFLHQVYNIIEDYHGVVTETVINENIVCIFELLDEMLDNGFPMTTEPNILKEIIRPPKFLRSITDAVTRKHTTVTSTLPSSQLSNIRWRGTDVKYTNNEAYFDLIEAVNVIIDKSGNVVTAEAFGTFDCLMKLSGFPDLTMSFNNARVIDDAWLHPCVRYLRWERERILSFVPPDGRFCLFNYIVRNLNPSQLPISVRHSVILRDPGSRMDVSVLMKNTGGKPLDQVKLEIQMPPEVLNVNATATLGKYTFDAVSKLLVWDVGRIESQRYPTLKGPIALATGSQICVSPVITLSFTLAQTTVSGLRVNRLDLYGENYKPFKGVKYATKAGHFEIRT